MTNPAFDEELLPEDKPKPPWDAEGYFTSLNSRQKRGYERQELFLEAYGTMGQILSAAEACEIDRFTVLYWDRENRYHFRERFELAKGDYREYREGKMVERLDDPDGNRGSDILFMFHLKAVWPDKYREAIVVGDDTAKQVLDKLGKVYGGPKKEQPGEERAG